MSPLTDEQLDRYARHIVLRDIGGAGQKKILDAHVLVVGAGGIGCPAIQYLAAAGIGALTIMDDDVVSLSNLQRQVLFGEKDVGKAKVEVAKVAAQRINPDVEIISLNQRLSSEKLPGDGEEFFAPFDAIIDGSDNYQTRLLVSDLSVKHHVPLVSRRSGSSRGSSAPSAAGKRTSPATAALWATRSTPMIATIAAKLACSARWSG